MASRMLMRRFLHVGKRVTDRTLVNMLRPLASLSTYNQSCGQMPQIERYSQIRGVKTTPGEGMVINIQDSEDFEARVLNSSVPVVVDFHATWCGPCKLLGPRLETKVGALNGKVLLAKVDVDDNADLAMEFMVSSIPMVVGIKDKKVQEKFIGLQDDDIIETFLEKLTN